MDMMKASSTTERPCVSVLGREEAFGSLVAQVQACRLCARMEGRARVLGSGNGDTSAAVMFVAEAPGRLGGDRFHIPLHGDRTGRNFDALLLSSGLTRRDIFITNAVLCNPRKADGTNDTPSRCEVVACSAHLRSTIELVQPRFVVSLGAVALRALGLVEPHSATLAANVLMPFSWYGRTLIPLYHPGPRALIHRSLPVQLEDYRRLGELVQV